MVVVPPISHRGVEHANRSSRWGAQRAPCQHVAERYRKGNSWLAGRCGAGAS
jgi:hypothetical protein